MTKRSLIFLLPLAVACCSSRGSQPGAEAPAELQMPSIPATLTAPADRAEYLSLHFWDHMDFGDAGMALDTAFVEQAFSNFISILPIVESPQSRVEAVASVIGQASRHPQSMELFMSTAGKYLYDVESPYRDEQLYEAFAAKALEAGGMPPADADRLRWRLEEIGVARVGEPAPPLRLLADGREATLDDLRAGGPLLVMFFDHDCESCFDTISKMVTNASLTIAMMNAGCRIAAVDLAEQPDLRMVPGTWAACELGEDLEGKYVARARPSFYLIDADGIVALRDGSYDMLLEHF